jgi:hypothetical protein
MHYKNGRQAKVGDIVVSKGYNVKDSKGNLATICGLVVGITPGAGTCNIRVAHGFQPWATNELECAPHVSVICNGQPPLKATDVEYGQCDHFLHVDDAVATADKALPPKSACEG